MVVNMEESQNSDQLVKESETDNVCHAERDYFVKVWIECQFTGLHAHDVGLRHRFHVFTVLHAGLRAEKLFDFSIFSSLKIAF